MVTKVLGMGGIIYKKIESGEIVADIARSADEGVGVKKVAEQVSKKITKTQSSDMADDDFSIENERRRRKKKSLPGVEKSGLFCPINEKNVDHVLDRTLLVTESLQQLLNTFKDELKRAGGGPTFGRDLKPTGLRKRLEIAEKLSKAYMNYQQAIDDIEDLGKNETGIDDEEFEEEDYYVDEEYLEEKAGTAEPAERMDLDHEDQSRIKSRNNSAAEKRTISKTVQPRNFPTPSRFQSGDDSCEAWREDMVAAKENKCWYTHATIETACGTNVSNDLWMSCEPGSDDETIYNVGFPKGNRK